jgi:hypothetical protein
MKNEPTEHKTRVTKHNVKLLTGSTADKYPVLMDDRKTIIFISDKSKESETRLRYSIYGQLNNFKY